MQGSFVLASCIPSQSGYFNRKKLRGADKLTRSVACSEKQVMYPKALTSSSWEASLGLSWLGSSDILAASLLNMLTDRQFKAVSDQRVFASVCWSPPATILSSAWVRNSGLKESFCIVAAAWIILLRTCGRIKSRSPNWTVVKSSSNSLQARAFVRHPDFCPVL